MNAKTAPCSEFGVSVVLDWATPAKVEEFKFPRFIVIVTVKKNKENPESSELSEFALPTIRHIAYEEVMTHLLANIIHPSMRNFISRECFNAWNDLTRSAPYYDSLEGFNKLIMSSTTEKQMALTKSATE